MGTTAKTEACEWALSSTALLQAPARLTPQSGQTRITIRHPYAEAAPGAPLPKRAILC